MKEKRERNNLNLKLSPRRPSGGKRPLRPLSTLSSLLFHALLLLVKLPAQHHRRHRSARRGQGPDLRVDVGPHILEREDRERLLDRDADLLDSQ